MSGLLVPGRSTPCVTDHLVLRTIDGAADLLAEDLRAMPSIHSTRQTSTDTVECTVDGPLGEFAACTLYSTVEVRDLERSLRAGLLSTLAHPIRFRVGDHDPERRQATITAIEQHYGWLNRPTNWDVNLAWSAAGWVVQFGPLAWVRRFGRPERLPWSTNLVVAEVLVRLAKVRAGDLVLDPFCGTGTILQAVRRREPGARTIGMDHDPHALDIAARNSHVLPAQAQRSRRLVRPATEKTALPPMQPAPTFVLVRAAAEALPIAPGGVNRIVANLPFGKQVGSHHGNRSLYPAVLAEFDRVLTADGRAVLLTEDKRLLREAVNQQPELKIVRERLLKYNGATPTAYVLWRVSQARTRLPKTAHLR